MLRGSSEEPVPLTPLHEPPPVPAHETPQPRITIPSRGHAESPLKRPDEHSPPEKPPAVTFVPSALPNDLLDTPKLFHPRLRLAIHLSTPVFMGGATIEGEIIVLIDGASARKKRKSKDDLSLKRIAVTLVGIERCKSRQEIFHALMCDLIDGSHPPPTNMVPHHGLGATWNVQASESTLPFRLDLPVLMGPPPFRSKEVGIRYNLSTLAEFSIAGKSHFARESRDIVVLTVHDRMLCIDYGESTSELTCTSRESSGELARSSPRLGHTLPFEEARRPASHTSGWTASPDLDQRIHNLSRHPHRE